MQEQKFKVDSTLDLIHFCWYVEGELVYVPPIECGRGSIDENCGCRRSMAGLVSERATTTVKVVDREELDPDTYCKLIAEAHRHQGYVTEKLMAKSEVIEWLRHVADELIFLAQAPRTGAVLERRGEWLNVRSG